MTYRTIVLELLQAQYPRLHENLRQQRTLLNAVNRYAIDLKNAHVAWMNELRRMNPGRDISQMASEALELAIEHLQGDLPSESPPNVPETDSLSLDEAMAHISRATLRA